MQSRLTTHLFQRLFSSCILLTCVTANMADPRSLIEIRITAARDAGQK